MNDLGMGITVSLKDAFTNSAQKIESSMSSLDGKVAKGCNNMSAHMEKLRKGSIAMGISAALLAIPTTLAATTLDTQKALAELTSLGVSDLDSLSKAASDFSNQWAGTNKADFITASYDIKSALSNLSDEAVGSFTSNVALAAKATKASVAEMSSAFTTGYGIFKPMMEDMDDMEWGEQFAGAMAKTVQSFKTNGFEMSNAIKNLGASATVANIPLAEQLAVLGALQTVSSGAESGTMYKSFMASLGRGGEKLGLNFVDEATGKFKGIIPIFKEIERAFPDLGQAYAQTELQSAFSDQGLKFINQLAKVIGPLEESKTAIDLAAQNGTSVATQMATFMNQDIGSRLTLLRQVMKNLADTLGTNLLPIINPIIDGFTKIATAAISFAETHPKLTKFGLIATGILGSIVFIGGAVASTIGLIGLVIPAVTTGLAVLGTMAGTAGATMSVAFSPVVLIVAGITAAIVGLGIGITKVFENFDSIKRKSADLWKGLVSGCGTIGKSMKNIGSTIMKGLSNALTTISNVGSQITESFSTILTTITKPFDGLASFLFESGKNALIAFGEGIFSAVTFPQRMVLKALKQVRELLPFSDAKRGPLSDLTASGKSFLSTFATGININHATVKKAAKKAISATKKQIIDIPVAKEIKAKIQTVLTTSPMKIIETSLAKKKESVSKGTLLSGDNTHNPIHDSKKIDINPFSITEKRTESHEKINEIKSPIFDELKALISEVKQIASRPVVLTIDGKKIAQAVFKEAQENHVNGYSF